jgi:hypothetical protein
MDEDYLRNIRYWLRTESARPTEAEGQWVAGWDARAEPGAPMIPPPRVSLE